MQADNNLLESRFLSQPCTAWPGWGPAVSAQTQHRRSALRLVTRLTPRKCQWYHYESPTEQVAWIIKRICSNDIHLVTA